jgi:hypothetical protein
MPLSSSRGGPGLTGLPLLVLLLAVRPVLAQHTDPSMNEEHQAMMNLVPTSGATHTAQASGTWSSTATWGGASVPGAGARVVIPAGLTVTYDVSSPAALRWIRVDGKLAFSRAVSTALTVETLVVPPGGEYEQGTAASPIPASVTSTVTFADTGALDTVYDPQLLSRGLLAHGRVRIHGAAVTPFLKTSSGLSAGATSLTLQATPSGWKVGDSVLVTGMRWSDSAPTWQDEVKPVAALSGASLTLGSGLAQARVVEFGAFGLYPYVANLSRNVTFRSANTTDVSRRGHVMFMHTPDVDVRYAAFVHLGRTRKDVDVTNAEGNVSQPGTNPRGRYAVHVHRAGKDDSAAAPVVIQGCVTLDATSWAYVNHDSYVVFEDNVAHRGFGSAFVTENGAERGAFRRNLASFTPGRGFIKDGVANHDLGRSGVGFWFQGSNLVVENNAAVSNNQGYSFFQRSNAQHNGSSNQRILRQNLIDPEASGGKPSIQSADTPIGVFKGNVAIANYEGMFNVDNEINGLWPTSSVLEDFSVLNSKGQASIRIEYYRNFTFKNVRVLRDSTMPPDPNWHGTWAINANHLVDHLYPWETRATDRLDGVYIRGHWNGIDNDDGDLGVSSGSPERIAKHEVIDNSVDFVGPGVRFANTGTLLGQPLVRYISRADVLPFPTFNPPAGTYATGQTVSISGPPGATLYYVLGNDGWQSPSLESQLKSGTWTPYTGPISISSTKKLIAIAVSGQNKSRPRNGVFTIDPTATGTSGLTRQVWSNVAGTTVADIPLSTPPSSTGTLTSFEAPSNVADNYGQRVRGYVVPPATGNYTFWLASDDSSELYLSSDATAANKVRIASVSGWTSSREWNKSPSQKSAVVSLTAGQRYYVEALMKEGAGGDNLAVGWLRPGQTGTVPSEVIPGSALRTWDGAP